MMSDNTRRILWSLLAFILVLNGILMATNVTVLYQETKSQSDGTTATKETTEPSAGVQIGVGTALIVGGIILEGYKGVLGHRFGDRK